MQSLVKEPEYSILPSRISSLKGRQREIYDIMLRLNKNKLVVVTGEEGMGKSSVIRNTCQHIKHRNYYQGGIIFINCKEFKTADNLVDELEKYVDGKGSQSSNSNGPKTEFVATSSNNFSSLFNNILRKKKILVVFDKVDQILKGD